MIGNLKICGFENLKIESTKEYLIYTTTYKTID